MYNVSISFLLSSWQFRFSAPCHLLLCCFFLWLVGSRFQGTLPIIHSFFWMVIENTEPISCASVVKTVVFLLIFPPALLNDVEFHLHFWGPVTPMWMYDTISWIVLNHQQTFTSVFSHLYEKKWYHLSLKGF